MNKIEKIGKKLTEGKTTKKELYKEIGVWAILTHTLIIVQIIIIII